MKNKLVSVLLALALLFSVQNASAYPPAYTDLAWKLLSLAASVEASL